MRDKGVNLNTLLLGILLALGKFGGSELFAEIKTVHDSMIGIKAEISIIQSYSLDTRTRLAAVEADIIKIKLDNNLR